MRVVFFIVLYYTRTVLMSCCRRWAEKEITLVEVYSRLKHYQELYPTQEYFKPSRLLENIVQSGASVREEMYYRKQKYAAK